jgi:hypothetical protein
VKLVIEIEISFAKGLEEFDLLLAVKVLRILVEFRVCDINFATVKAPTYSGNSSGGTLTVTDGAHSANMPCSAIIWPRPSSLRVTVMAVLISSIRNRLPPDEL